MILVVVFAFSRWCLCGGLRWRIWIFLIVAIICRWLLGFQGLLCTRITRRCRLFITARLAALVLVTMPLGGATKPMEKLVKNIENGKQACHTRSSSSNDQTRHLDCTIFPQPERHNDLRQNLLACSSPGSHFRPCNDYRWFHTICHGQRGSFILQVAGDLPFARATLALLAYGVVKILPTAFIISWARTFVAFAMTSPIATSAVFVA